MDKRTRHYHLQRKVRTQWLLVLAGITTVVYMSQPVQTPISPCPDTGCVLPTVPKVEAAEPIVETYGAPSHIVDLVVRYFGDEAQNALKIMKCESRFDKNIVGDGHLTTVNNGEVVGDSIGLMQIRTGGKGWNRAKANGMTADEFRNNLKNEEFNIKYAKSIFDKSGWSAWFNCMNKELK